MRSERAALGWEVPEHENVRLRFATDPCGVRRLVEAAEPHSIHVCQGLQSNGMVSVAQKQLMRRGLPYWVVMEMVDDSGWRGLLKRMFYAFEFRRKRSNIRGVLTIGFRTREWVIARGMLSNVVFDFAYFLPPMHASSHAPSHLASRPFRFIYVGQYIERKRVSLLLQALHGLRHEQFELELIGSGPLEEELREQAAKLLPGRVLWSGQKKSSEVARHIAEADCLVLPSRHDGWGAVVSEALLNGTKVICSDRCGSAGTVLASGEGGVFGDNFADLIRLLSDAIAQGRAPFHERNALSRWAASLDSNAGAQYFLEILSHYEKGGSRPQPPWTRSEPKYAG